jgi:uncharacterized protein YecE (DUF72 family)
MGSIHIGTSGWSYPHWRGAFFPEDLPASAWLDYYAQRFATVELNNAFYQLPRTSTLEGWAATVPDGFCFAVKASRYITHMKKLKNARDTVPRFLDTIAALGDRLGPILFQLPPNWRCNVARLQDFLAQLPAGHRYTLEFRDPSWFTPAVYACLAEANAALCIYELEHHQSPLEVTADFVYIRLHGPGDAYQGSYDDATLAGWAERLRTWADEGRDVYCYFDNDEAGYAAQDAARLQQRLMG